MDTLPEFRGTFEGRGKSGTVTNFHAHRPLGAFTSGFDLACRRIGTRRSTYIHPLTGNNKLSESGPAVLDLNTTPQDLAT